MLSRCLCLLLAMCLTVSLAQEDYEYFPTVPGSLYKLYPIYLNWTEAVTVCQYDGDGAHLVVINSQEEADVVGEMALRVEDQFVYVGINDIVVEGTWLTILGCLVSDSGYNTWYGSNPDDDNGDEDCGIMWWDGNFNDITCKAHIPFVCEKPNPSFA